MNVIIANIITFIANMFSIYSTTKKNKNKIVLCETISTFLRIIQCLLVKGFTEVISKIIKFIMQMLTLKKLYKKNTFYIASLLYILVSIGLVIYTKKIILLFPIIPSILEFYALLNRSVKKYRIYIIITKLLWTINNIAFKLYVGIIFDALVVIGHLYKLNKTHTK